MNLLENIRMSLSSLWSNRLRSFLALLGIVIGVFAVTAMVSLGQMATAAINNSLESVTGKSIIIQPDYHNGGMNFTRLTEEDINALSMLPVTLNPQLNVSGFYEKKPGDRRSIQISGTRGNLPKYDSSIKIAQGRFFSDEEARGGTAVAVLNPKAAEEVLRTSNPVGKNIRIFFPKGGRADLKVVGMMEALPAMFGGNQPLIIMPTPFLWRTHPDVVRGKFDFCVLKVKGNLDVNVLQKQATKIIESRYNKGTFMIESTESFQTVLQSITMVLQAFLGAIAGFSLVVGGIGIMNIMLVSVTERTREIGLRKALGATSQQIRQQFIIEAVTLTTAGGIIGVASAALILWLISVFVPFLNVFILNPLTIVLALSVSVLVGLFFGVWPAARAAKLDPIESLRYE